MCLIILESYQQQTPWGKNIIVWPEAAIPVYPQQIKPIITAINQRAKKYHSTLITGIPIYQQQQAFNGMMVLGDGSGRYVKRHLVPFGEYIPLPTLFAGLIHHFNIPLSSLGKGPHQQNPLLAGNIPFAAFICYEIAYPQLVLDSMKKQTVYRCNQ